MEQAAQNVRSESDADKSLRPQEAVLLRLLPELSKNQKYQIGNIVRQGGMGAVLEAQQLGIERRVAMKVLLPQPTEAAQARFIDEVRITGQLEHPNIVPVHELGIGEDQQLFYTMKFVQGITLHDALEQIKHRDLDALRRFTLTELLNIFQKVCDAVAFAHSRNVIHRDLTPANIMLGPFGEALVMDWGLAKQIGEDCQVWNNKPFRGSSIHTQDGSVVGTPSFMSPEQASGEFSRVDHRTDIYALGAILHTMIHLRPLVAGKNVLEILGKVKTGERDAKVETLPHLPAGKTSESLEAVIRKATALIPDDRYQRVEELQDEIRAYQNGFATRAEKANAWKLLALAIRRYKSEVVLFTVSIIALALLTTISFVKVSAERNLAKKALSDLRSAAPAFAIQARFYALNERYNEAIETLDYAIQLQPDNSVYLLNKANLLQACLRFREAARTYRQVSSAFSQRGEINARLCDQWAAETARNGKLSSRSMADLFQWMLREQRPTAELMPIARILGRERELAVGYWTERLRDLPIGLEPPIEKRLKARSDGLLSLDLSSTAVADLRPLEGMPLGDLNLAFCPGMQDLSPIRALPITDLDISETSITNLSPLQGGKLQTLSIRGCAVTDLSPLAGLPLRGLDASHTEITNFAALNAAPLEWLFLGDSKVRDLRFLERSPVKVLRLDGCNELTSLSALPALHSLETLILPENFIQLPGHELAAVRALRGESNLQRISVRAPPGHRTEIAETSSEFWSKWGGDLEWIEQLQNLGIKSRLTRLSDQTWRIEVREQSIADLSWIKHAPVSELDLFATSVRDIQPLAGKALHELDLRLTMVTNLAPLRSMPLRRLFLWQSKATDFSVISTLRDLELLDISATAFSDLRLIGAPRLTELRMGSTKVNDLSPLTRFPLQKLHCDSLPVKTVAPLLECRSLVWIIPPEEAKDIVLLKGLPNLKRISYTWGNESEPKQTADEFWESISISKQPDHPL